jgi:hypothetical protein
MLSRAPRPELATFDSLTKISGRDRRPKLQATAPPRGRQRRPCRSLEKHDALLEQYGKNGDHQIVTRETKAIYNYDIEITLAPIK